MNSKNRFVLINLLAFEFVLLNLVLFAVLYFRLPDYKVGDPEFGLNVTLLTVIYNFSWLFIILYIRDNEFYFNADYGYFKSLLICLFFFVGFATALVVLVKISYFRRSTYILPIFIFSYLNLISYKYLMKFLKRKGAHLFSNTLLLGADYAGGDLNRFINTMTHYGYNVMGYLQKESKKYDPELDLMVQGEIDDLADVLYDNNIDEIFISLSDIAQHKVTESIEIADSFGVRVKLIPDNPLLMSKSYKAVTMGDLAVFKLRQSPLDEISTTILKRLFDFCFALITLIVCLPMFLIIAVLIKLDSKGPVFYSPFRKGEGGHTFRCYKFRTMSVCEDPLHGTRSTAVNDPRITRIGRFLRKSDLDELPQFLNVLKGEMSVIGPRPASAESTKRF